MKISTTALHRLRLITALSVLITGSSSVLAQPELSGTPDELRDFLVPRPNLVNISGEGELTSYKDVARVSLVVTTDARTLNEAMALNQTLRQRLIATLLEAGIPQSDINNSKFSSSPQFGMFGRTPNRFEVSARLEVSVTTEEHLQLLATAADNHDEVKFEATSFEHSQEDDFEVQVRELALQDVMSQKAYYESSLDLQLRAVNFYYGGVVRKPRAMPMVAMQQELASDLAVRGTSASMVSPTVAPGFDEVEYQTSVTVVFEIVNDD